MNDINASSLDEQGKKEYAKGAYLAAAKFFAQAGQAYENANDPLNAAEMKNNQSVALLQGGKAQDALKATEGTEEIFAGAGDFKKWQEALAEYDRAAALFEQAGEGDMHSTVRKASANIHLKFGHVNSTQMDVYDSLRLVENPTFAKRIMRFLKRSGFIK